MKVLKKSALSLAVAGVVYGTALTPAYSYDVPANADGGNTVVRTDLNGDADVTTVNVTSALTSSNDGSKAGLTIDVDDGTDADAGDGTDSAGSAFSVNVNINAAVDGTVAKDGDPTGAVNGGVLIHDSVNSFPGDSLGGSVNVNANVTGGAFGLKSAVDIAGDVTVASGVTIKGDEALVLEGALSAGSGSTGKVTINGTLIGNATSGSGLVVKGAIAGGILNTGTISGHTGVDIDAAANFENRGTVTGGFNVDTGIASAITNSGTITGNITGDTTTVENSKTITADQIDVKSVNNTAAGTITITGDTATLTAETLKNSGTIAGTGILSITAANVGGSPAEPALVNSGKLTAASVSFTTGGFSNTGTMTLSGALATKTDSSNTGTIIANSLDADDALDNSGSITLTAASTIDDKLTNTGSFVAQNDLTITGGGFDNGDADNTSASLKVTGALSVTGDANNYGTLNAGNLVLGTTVFTNKGTASVGAITGTGSIVNNGGNLTISDGSVGTLSTFDNRSGSTTVHLTNDLATTGLTITGAATINSASKLGFTASDTVLALTGDAATNANAVLLNSGAVMQVDVDGSLGDYVEATHGKLSVTSGSILLDVSDVRYDTGSNNILANIQVKQASDLVKASGGSTVKQALATQAQAGFTGQAAVKTAVEKAYGTFAANTGSSEQLESYLDNIRPDDSNSAAAAGATVTQAVMGNISSRSSAVRTGKNFGDMQASGGFWVQGLYGKSDQKSREGAKAYKGDLRGMTFGLDREFGNSTTGMAFSYGKSDIDFSTDQKDTVKSYVASVYNIWEHGNIYVDTSFSFGTSKHESKRWSGNETAKYGSTQLGGQATVGYYLNFNDVMLEPMASARLTSVSVDAVKYANAGETDATSYRQMEVGFGAAVSKAFEVGSGMLTPRFGAMYYHDFVGDQLDTQVTFAGTPQNIKGASAIKNSWELNLGVSYAMGENLDLSAGYTRVMKNDFSSDNFNAKLKYMF